MLNTPSCEDNHLETDVCSAGSGMDETGHHEVFQGTSDGVASVLVCYRVSFMTPIPRATIMSSSLTGVRNL
jgi:hypothetical protein